MGWEFRRSSPGSPQFISGKKSRHGSSSRTHLARGVDELEATHKAADDVVAKFRAIARSRRKARREAKLGPDANRFPCRITKRDAERIARAVRAELGRLRIERFLQDQGYSRDEIREMIPDRQTRETTHARAVRKGWSAQRRSAVIKAERTALETVRSWYGRTGKRNETPNK
jgi:hypothetical protein